jgi:Ca2+-transporting ATPase
MNQAPLWQTLSAAETAAQLGVDPERGLTPEQVTQRLSQYGRNTLPEAVPPSLWTLIWRQLKSFIVVVLLSAAVLSAALGELGDALAIFAALLINVVVGFLMDFRAERDIASLRSLSSPKARVRRDGHEVELLAAEVLPGDVVLLDSGDRVPADARLFSGECAVDESLLTGESLAVDKTTAALPAEALAPSQRKNELFAGSLVRVGSGVVLITAIGQQTELGRIGKLLSTTKPPPVPLNLRLAKLGRYIVWMVAAVGALLLILGLWQRRPFWPLLRTAVILAVAAIPEGLPSVATLALAAAARRLVKQKLRVRHLGVLEALGGITTLCLDKTGTLTANAMTVRAVQLPGHQLTVTGEGFTPSGEFQEDGKRIEPGANPLLLELLRTTQRCNDATLEEEGGIWHIHGDPSEGALLCAAAKAGLPAAQQASEEARLRTISAGRSHPWMVVVTRGSGGESIHVKGAPEQVLARCTTVRTAAGSQALDQTMRADWLAANQRMADGALRVFGVATAGLSGGAAETDVEQGWQWLGLVGMADPPRQGVKQALALAHRAGIRTIMITGDQPATALAIARELDLADGLTPKVLTGAEAPVADVDVYARATPEGKYQLVRALQQAGQQVGMTGDGVNDAPALRAADAGIAMGNGTEVAKSASAIILLDESLPTLLLGIQEGRAVFRNIQKALDYLLSCSIATVLAAFIAMAVGNPPILSALQILYLNLLMHTFPALGLTLERANPEVMQRAPLPLKASLLPPARMAAILWHGVVIGVAAVAVGAWGLHHEGEAHGRSLAFATLATSLLLHSFSDRSSRPFGGWAVWRNPTLLACVGVALALQLLALYLPGLSRLLTMTRFTVSDWLAVLCTAVGTVVAVEVSKWAFPQGESQSF